MTAILLLDVSRPIWRAWRGQLPTGIDRACLAYIDHYGAHALAVAQRGGLTRVLPAALSARLFELLLVRPRDFRRALIWLAARALGSGIDNHDLQDAVYLNVGHTGLDRAGHARWVRKSRIRPIYYVHDLIPITHPEYTRAGQPERHALRMEALLRLASGIICNSQASVEALTRFARHRELTMPPTLVAPLGLSLDRAPIASAAPLAAPYFLTVGTIEGRKNHLLLLRIWQILSKRLGNATPKLVIIGQRGWSAEAAIAILDRDLTLAPHLIEIGCCDDALLHAYLGHATALLFPSFVEGQGLPLIEALAQGTPVIASDLAVFRELARDVPEYRDPDDVDGWVRTILDYLAPNSPERSAQLTRLSSFEPPTWNDHFAAVEAWLAQRGLYRQPHSISRAEAVETHNA